MTIALIILFLLSAAAIVFLYFENKKNATFFQNEIKKLSEENLQNKKTFQNEIDEILSNAENLKKELATLKNENQTNKLELEHLQNFINNNFEKITVKQEKPQTIYFVKPIDNGFPTDLQSLQPENTVYELSINDDGKNANFIIHKKGADAKDIIKRSEMYVKPACIELNVSEKDSSKIVTQKPGEAALENNIWVIKKKAEISYE